MTTTTILMLSVDEAHLLERSLPHLVGQDGFVDHRCDHQDVRTRLAQPLGPAGGHAAPADDNDASPGQVEEEGIAHAGIVPGPCNGDMSLSDLTRIADPRSRRFLSEIRHARACEG